jgi:histidinol-phosphate aminotransferase
VVLDEAYTEYLPPELRMDSAAWVRRYPNLIVSRTLSKAYGLAGLRVGYAIAHEGITDLLNRLRQPFNVNSLALAAAQAVLDDEDYLARSYALNRSGLEQLQSAFSAMQLRFVPSYANFVLVEVGDADAVYAALLRQGVIVRPVANYGLPRWLRVSVGLPEENARFIDALSQALRPASSRASVEECRTLQDQSTAAVQPERSCPQIRIAAGP